MAAVRDPRQPDFLPLSTTALSSLDSGVWEALVHDSTSPKLLMQCIKEEVLRRGLGVGGNISILDLPVGQGYLASLLTCGGPAISFPTLNGRVLPDSRCHVPVLRTCRPLLIVFLAWKRSKPSQRHGLGSQFAQLSAETDFVPSPKLGVHSSWQGLCRQFAHGWAISDPPPPVLNCI